MQVNLVVAMARNRVIGRAGTLPWHLPLDLQRFKQITLGFPLVMGRVTHQSIGRALPGRSNIVVTRNREYRAAGCMVVTSLDAALEFALPAAHAMVIGGRALYAAALSNAQRIYLTEVHAAIDGDVHFPEYDPGAWREQAREFHARDERHAYDFSFVVLERSPRAD